MATKTQIIKEFKETIPAWRSASTKYRYPYLVGMFIDCIGAKQEYTKADAIKFLNRLSNAGKSPGYVRWAAYILTTFYNSLDLRPPFRKGEYPPKAPESKLLAPSLSKNKVIELIHAVKERGDSRMKAYLVLSTTYGLRVSELAIVRPSDISNGEIVIHTQKGGDERTHIIPGEIAGYLNYRFVPLTTQTLNYMFAKMKELAGQKHMKREGYHAIRRGLSKELEDAGVKPSIINSFFRWKSTTYLGILGVYTRPDPAAADRKVFKKHPFIGEWK